MAIRIDHYLIRALMVVIAAQCAGWINTMSHNFIHQRNNLHMYAANLVLVGWRDWRVFHGLVRVKKPFQYEKLIESLAVASLISEFLH